MGPPPTTTWEWPPGDASWQREIDDVLARPRRYGRARGATLDDCIAAFAIIDEAYRR